MQTSLPVFESGPPSRLDASRTGRLITPSDDRDLVPSGPAAYPHVPAGDAGRLDGRRTHVVDRAADYVALAAGGLSVARIARRRRRSKAYVSVLLRFGRLLATLPSDERAALRHPRITWTLAQRLMRADVDAASARSQLRAALGGLSTHTVRRRRPDPEGGSPAPPPPLRPGVAWGWDAAWFARDPDGYVAAHLQHLTALHAAVAHRATRAARAPDGGPPATRRDVGQGLRTLQRSLGAPPASGRPGAGPNAAAALVTLARIGAALAPLVRSAGDAPPAGPDPIGDIVAADAPGTASSVGEERTSNNP